MGRLPQYYRSGTFGDAREKNASAFLRKFAPEGDADAALAMLEEFHGEHQPLLHIGPEKGRFLDEAVRERAPSSVLEIGAYIGYSAIRIARLLPVDAHVISLEENLDNAGLAKENIAHAGLKHRVTVLHGTVQKFSGTLRPVDMIFMDHKKALYLEELHRLESLGLIRAGTVVVADNVQGLKHLAKRQEAIEAGKRKYPCNCQNKACNYVNYVKRSEWYDSRTFWGSRDGVEVSRAKQSPTRCGNDAMDGREVAKRNGTLHERPMPPFRSFNSAACPRSMLKLASRGMAALYSWHLPALGVFLLGTM